MAKGKTSAPVKAAKGAAALNTGIRIEPGGRAAGYFHKDKSLKGRPEVGAAPRFKATRPLPIATTQASRPRSSGIATRPARSRAS